MPGQPEFTARRRTAHSDEWLKGHAKTCSRPGSDVRDPGTVNGGRYPPFQFLVQPAWAAQWVKSPIRHISGPRNGMRARQATRRIGDAPCCRDPVSRRLRARGTVRDAVAFRPCRMCR